MQSPGMFSDAALVQHLMLLAGTVLPALAIGLPLGVWCYFFRLTRGGVYRAECDPELFLPSRCLAC